MGTYPDWQMLEDRGLIQPSPGREEAVKAALAHAAMKAAQRDTMKAPSAERQ